MADLPTGTITLLFTDIEGSTRLLQQLGDSYAILLDDYRRIMHGAVARAGGNAVDTEGDAFFAVFPGARAAVDAALAAQRALAAHAWPGGLTLRARMGLHTGEPKLTGTGYVGLDVHRAARLCAAGHGGQVLLSATTEALVVHDLPPEVHLRDLGLHRLKDLHQPTRIFQLVHADLLVDFPPLRSLESRPNNLPSQPTLFVGRDHELRAVRQRLLQPEARLLTLTGPAGTGKTRLALQVAADLLDDFPDGVWFVNLAPISDPMLVASTIAATLEVKEAADQPLVETLKSVLCKKQLLLLLDNFEQVLPAAPLVADLLATARGLTVLVTSRALLGLYGEYDVTVPSLALPDPAHLPPLEQLSQYEAVRLFIERAQAAKADFSMTTENAPAVVEICARLDGLPLAIELAAARVRLLSPQAMLPRLSNRLKLLIGGGRDLPARHQTLRGAIEWSYSLLDAGEQTLLRRLAVFAGGCTMEAAEAVGTVDGDLTIDMLEALASLADKSLVQQQEGVDGEPRFSMLETIREYALEQLARSEDAAVLSKQHAAYYLHLAEVAEPELKGQQVGLWLRRLEAEHGNLRAALDWSLGHGAPEETALRFATALANFWYVRGYWSEGRRRLETALARVRETRMDSAPVQTLKMRGLSWAGTLAHARGEYAAACAYYEESLLLARELGHTASIAIALGKLGTVARVRGDYTTARSYYEESLLLARELGHTASIAITLGNLGTVARGQGDYTTARAYYEESLLLARELGHKASIAIALGNLGTVARGQGDYTTARSYYEESLLLARELGHKASIAITLGNLGTVASVRGDYATARAYYEESLLLARELGHKASIADCLEGIADMAARQGKTERAARLRGMVEALREGMPPPAVPVGKAPDEGLVLDGQVQLDEAAFPAAWEGGQAITLEQAIAYALEADA